MSIIWDVQGRPRKDRGGGCCCLGVFLLLVLALAFAVWVFLGQGELDTPDAPPEAETPGVEAPLAREPARPLDQRGAFGFEDIPLEHALELLADRAGLELRVLESAAPVVGEQITWSTPSSTVRQALDELTRDRDLTYRLDPEEGTLIVRSRGDALREIDPAER